MNSMSTHVYCFAKGRVHDNMSFYIDNLDRCLLRWPSLPNNYFTLTDVHCIGTVWPHLSNYYFSLTTLTDAHYIGAVWPHTYINLIIIFYCIRVDRSNKYHYIL